MRSSGKVALFALVIGLCADAPAIAATVGEQIQLEGPRWPLASDDTLSQHSRASSSGLQSRQAGHPQPRHCQKRQSA